MVETALYSAAGFLLALLFFLLVVPFFTTRAAERAVRELRENLPFSAKEMAAEKDQLRAEHAINIRKAEIALEKLKEKSIAQQVQMRAMEEQRIGTEKVSRASKLALEEIKMKEQELHDRIRRSETQYANLETRTRQMLRENKELKIALRKLGQEPESALRTSGTGLEEDSENTVATPSKTSKSGLPIADPTLALQQNEKTAEAAENRIIANLRSQLSKAKAEIKRLKEKEESSAKSAMTKPAPARPRLPKADLPVSLTGNGTGATMRPTGNNADIEVVRNDLFDFAAKISALSVKLEGDKSPLPDLLKDVDASENDSLSGKIKALLQASGLEGKATPKPVVQKRTPAKRPVATTVKDNTATKKPARARRTPSAITKSATTATATKKRTATATAKSRTKKTEATPEKA